MYCPSNLLLQEWQKSVNYHWSYARSKIVHNSSLSTRPLGYATKAVHSLQERGSSWQFLRQPSIYHRSGGFLLFSMTWSSLFLFCCGTKQALSLCSQAYAQAGRAFLKHYMPVIEWSGSKWIIDFVTPTPRALETHAKDAKTAWARLGIEEDGAQCQRWPIVTENARTQLRRWRATASRRATDVRA